MEVLIRGFDCAYRSKPIFFSLEVGHSRTKLTSFWSLGLNVAILTNVFIYLFSLSFLVGFAGLCNLLQSVLSHTSRLELPNHVL